MNGWTCEGMSSCLTRDTSLSVPGFSPSEKREKCTAPRLQRSSVARGGSMKRTDETDAYSIHQTASERGNVQTSNPYGLPTTYPELALRVDELAAAVGGHQDAQVERAGDGCHGGKLPDGGLAIGAEDERSAIAFGRAHGV